MRVLLAVCLALIVNASSAAPVVLVIHGGAGAIPRAELSAEQEAAVRADLERALKAGFAVIEAGGTALDAVTAPIVILEDSPRFNAGKGAVLTAEGKAELDASIMEGHTRRAGAVAGLHHVKNPIRLARAVMERSRHVMMIGDGAERFGRSVGIEMVPRSYFVTEHRREDLRRVQAAQRAKHSALPSRYTKGTVGAVALDRNGHLAAATSTGGMTNKKYGRVGDAPIIGAGTYANATCGVSATGWGEFFIRVGVAREICARMEYKGESVVTAAAAVLADVAALGGDGGVIVLDDEGNVALPFNSEGMYRGTIDADGNISTAIFRE
jgi:beta-aspartyl-peptidase (threonine type)